MDQKCLLQRMWCDWDSNPVPLEINSRTSRAAINRACQFLPYFSVAYRFVSSVGQNVCRINLLQELKSQKKKPNRNTYWINTQRRQKVMRGVWPPCRYDEGGMSAYTKMSGKFFVRLPLVSVKLSAKGMGHRSADSESGVRNQYVSHFCRNMSLSTATIDVK